MPEKETRSMAEVSSVIAKSSESLVRHVEESGGGLEGEARGGAWWRAGG